MKTFSKILIGGVVFFFLANFSEQESEISGNRRPKISFYGTLITDKTYNVQDITISGRYKQIDVYQKPEDININPDVNTTKIDLAEIKEIRPKSTEIVQFNKRDYIEITVISRDKNATKNDYIIEATKKIYCSEINDAGPIEKEIKFQGLKSLIIDGYKRKEDGEIDTSREQVRTTTAQIVRELEDSANKLDPENLETFKDKFARLISELRSSLSQLFK